MKKNKTLYIALAGVIVVVSLFAISRITPSKYDAFAQCLTEADATFYGAFWCGHCTEQKRMLGNAMKHIDYVECSTPDGQNMLPSCREIGIQSYPTWELASGERLVGLQTLETLAEKTGCNLPETS